MAPAAVVTAGVVAVAVVAPQPVVVTAEVAVAVEVEVEEAPARRIRASRAKTLATHKTDRQGRLKRHASAMSNNGMTLEAHHAATQETSRAMTSITSNRPATPLPVFRRRASQRAIATTSGVDVPVVVVVDQAALVAEIMPVMARVGRAVLARSAAVKA